MRALEQKHLLEACRALSEAVRGQPILPPLIRGAGEAEASGRRVHHCAAGDAWIRIEARFDKAYVNLHEFPLKRLPLVIDCALCDAERRPQEKELDAEEKFALLSAFFLAAETPIGAEPIKGTGEYRLSLRLSPTFVVEWREAFDPAAPQSRETLCRRVSASLWEKSREFFASERMGFAVWSLRAAQELFGAPKLSPRAIEDFVAASLADARADRAETLLPLVAQSRAQALALMVSSQRQPVATESAAPPAPLGRDDAAVPSRASDRNVALLGKDWRGVAAGFFAALIPIALALSVAAYTGVYRKGDVDAPGVEAADARAPAPAATATTASGANQAAAPGAGPAAVPGVGQAVASTEAPRAENLPPAAAPAEPSVADRPPAEDAAAEKPAAESKTVVRRTARAPTRRRHGQNPFATVGHAVGKFARDVMNGLSSIPRRFAGSYPY